MNRYISIFIAVLLLAGIGGCSVADTLSPAIETEMQPGESPAPPIIDDKAAMESGSEDIDTKTDEQESDDMESQEHVGDTEIIDGETEAIDGETEVIDGDTEIIEEIEPPRFGFIDAHADTITRALLPQHNANLFRNNLHIDFERLTEFGAPVQVFVLWCADRYVANAFEYTNSLIDFFEVALAEHSDIIELALTLEDMERNARNNKISAVLSIEGGEALMGDISNLEHFYDRGVRIFGLVWNRENELGFGQETGSDKGLKPFGAEVVKRVEELGMIMDISHLNEAGFWDAHRISTRPYMASHSNSYSVTPHKRNLTDDQIMAIVDRGGIVGLALYPVILTEKRSANMNDIMAHIEQFIQLGAGDNLGLGCDLDGFGTMPSGLTDVLSLKILEREISERYDDDTAYSIMAGNFYDFFVRFYRG